MDKLRSAFNKKSTKTEKRKTDYLSLNKQIFGNKDQEKEQEQKEQKGNSKKGSKKKQKKKSNNKNAVSNKDREVRTVFVGNIPIEVKPSQLRQHFTQFGEIESIRFRSFAQKEGKKKARNQKDINKEVLDIQNAYIVFKTQEQATHALEMNSKKLFGKHIRVDNATRNNNDEKFTIFIGNIPFDTKEENVRLFFKECGKIEYVRLIREKFSRKGKGIGYVKFKKKKSVRFATGLNGEFFQGRKIRITKSNHQKSQQALNKKKKKRERQNERNKLKKERKYLDKRNEKRNKRKRSFNGSKKNSNNSLKKKRTNKKKNK
ncbi:eukaryotic translation initiation factor 4b/4h [Anaeramoeba flamelloides]|uniref:Eukaryotic translation initiation factor 4b/4h n=1 Tax=Anaeramoeba flamelloides TaxID=1746091 RepID=A0AAV7ZHE9_9EUKA|nr:eukaryotic translation initiation factor 4b/4h [Anaeramoeba flamelloides]